MKRGIRNCAWFVCTLTAVGLACAPLLAQMAPNERTFKQSKAAIEKALGQIHSAMSGRLPTLDGFANAGDHPLDHYRRAFYQAAAEVTSAPSGGCVVRITTKVTAWYAGPIASRSGYQLLKSSGRIESDILDQLADKLSEAPEDNLAAAVPPQQKNTNPVSTGANSNAPSAPTPVHQFPTHGSSLASSLSHPAEPDASKSEHGAPKPDSALQAEAGSLEEILKNTAHPKNLVAVKKSGTPVVSTPSLNAKPQFLASMHDEFEMLDFNGDWVHVRISGLSRGWIWRDGVEMPDGIPDTAVAPATHEKTAADLFRVAREETAPFPGDWQPLRSKNVKIISVQQVDENSTDAGPKQRLEFAKYLLDKSYKEIAQKQDLQGVVVIFDSADGGMIAATTATLQQWITGSLSDAGMWHQCFFDPPETFDSAAPSGGK